jgi:hypothetical protein
MPERWRCPNCGAVKTVKERCEYCGTWFVPPWTLPSTKDIEPSLPDWERRRVTADIEVRTRHWVVLALLVVGSLYGVLAYLGAIQ